MIRLKLAAMALVMLLLSLSTTQSLSAASPVTQVAVCGSTFGNFFGFQPWYACLPKDCPDHPGDGTPRICSMTDIYKIAFVVVDWIIKAAAYVAAGMIFFMLFKIAMSRGNSSQYSTAISGIRDAVIGLVIAMLSIAIMNFIAGAFVP